MFFRKREKISDKDRMEEFWGIREKVLNGGGTFRNIYMLNKIQRFYGSGIPITPDINKFMAPHGLYGIFISQLAYVAPDCTIFHQVTIGSNMLKDSKKLGAPIIEEGCYIGAGAKIIGAVHVGKNVRIGANCVVTDDIPDNATVVLPKPVVYQYENKRDNTFVPMSEFREQRNKEFQITLKEYCRKHKKIYIYGIGGMACKYKEVISKYSEIEGYIVSDGHKNNIHIDGIKVLSLSELDITDKMGIVVCMNRKNQMEVVQNLEKVGIKNFLCIDY